MPCDTASLGNNSLGRYLVMGEHQIFGRTRRVGGKNNGKRCRSFRWVVENFSKAIRSLPSEANDDVRYAVRFLSAASFRAKRDKFKKKGKDTELQLHYQIRERVLERRR